MLPRTICRMEQRPLDISPPCAKPLGSFQGVSAACFLRGTGGESQIRQWPTLGKCWLSGTLDYLESKSQSTNDELCNLEQTTPSTRPTRPTRQRGGEREILKALCKFKLVTQVSKRVSSPLHRRGKSKVTLWNHFSTSHNDIIATKGWVVLPVKHWETKMAPMWNQSPWPQWAFFNNQNCSKGRHKHINQLYARILLTQNHGFEI